MAQSDKSVGYTNGAVIEKGEISKKGIFQREVGRKAVRSNRIFISIKLS